MKGFYYGCNACMNDDEEDDGISDLTLKVHRLDVTKALISANPAIESMVAHESERRKVLLLIINIYICLIFK